MIPLFIELRNLNFEGCTSLSTAIYDNLSIDGGEERFSFFEAGLSEGIFSIFLDGFDEINPIYLDSATRLISKFSRRFKKSSLIISTRPGTGIHSLTDYHVYNLRPLNKDQAIELIEKTKFDEIAKSKFLDALNSGLYEKHKSMMSIPILIVMMLLTFRSYGEIPDRMTVFYNQAFDTLYSIHDAEGKESYKRTHSSGLPPDLFRQVLNAFCFISLCNYEIEFDKESLHRHVSSGIKIARADCTPDEFISDLIKNVCVLQPDGLSYLFVHRSFQEYFASTFVSRYFGKKRFEAYDRIISVSGPDLYRMLVEIDRPKLYRQWLLPKLETFEKRLDSERRASAFDKYKIFSDGLVLRHDQLVVIPALGRTQAAIDASRFGFMIETDLNVASLFAGLEFSASDRVRLEAEMKKATPEGTSDSAVRRALQRRRLLFEPTDSEGILSRSNFNDLYENYLIRVKNAIREVRKIVEEDVLIEDILFE